jgi:hypothetical protein
LEKHLAAMQLVCHVDFEYLSDATPARVFGALAQEFARSLGDADPGNEMADALRFSNYLCHALEARPTERMVLLIEELGALPKSSRFALANALRAIFNDRLKPNRRALSRLMVIVAGNIELYDLAYTDVSPFANICESHYLEDLSEQEVLALITEVLFMLDIPLDISSPLAMNIYQRAHGYPYLTQRLGYALETAYEEEKILGDEILEEAVTDLLYGGDPLIDHLKKALHDQKLMPAAQSVLVQSPRFSRHEEALARLELTGLVKPYNGYWHIRNPLFGRAVQTWAAAIEKNDASILTRGIVRIFNYQGIPIGAGFLLNDKRVLTCAHVVASALGSENVLPPDGVVSLDFPLIPKNAPVHARIVRNQPYEEGKVDDIVVLELLEEPPDSTTPLRFVQSSPQWGKTFRVCGFPIGREDGAWADGQVRERISDGRFQLIDMKSTGYAIQPGFSGSPVWDEDARGVIGMIVAADSDQNVKAAFMIPAKELQKTLEH